MNKLKVSIILFVFLFASNVFANEAWAIYLFNEESRKILKVYEDGSTENFTLELQDGESLRSILASPDTEDLIAYCSIAEAEDAFEMRFVLHNLATNEIQSHSNTWPSDDCNVHDFSPEAVVFSQYISRYNSQDLAPSWNIILMDSTEGFQAELSPESPIIDDSIAMLLYDAEGNLTGINPMPFFLENRLFLTLDDLHEAPFTYAFEWDIAANSLSIVENQRQAGSHYLASTGELAYADMETGAVFIRDAAGNEQLLFEDSEWEAITAFFLNNGQALAIFLSPIAEGDVTIRYHIMDRDGNTAEYIFPDGVFGTAHSAPNGVAMLISRYEQGKTHYELEVHNLADDERQVLWEDDSGAFWYVIGTVGDEVPENLAPFPSQD